MFDLHDPTAVARLIGLVVPLLVALVTKQIASQGLKGVLNALLSAVGGSVAYLVTKENGYDFEGFVNSVASAFVVSITAYYGVYKPTGITGSVANATSGFGFGTKPVLETEGKGADDPANSAGLPVDSSDVVARDVEDENVSSTDFNGATEADYEAAANEGPEDEWDPSVSNSDGVPVEFEDDLPRSDRRPLSKIRRTRQG